MRFIQTLIFIGFLVIAGGCSQENDVDYEQLEGSWQASWTLTDTSLLTLYSPHQLHMSGEMTFKNRNRVFIRAHGYEGCALASDTAENQLFFKYQDNSLFLINDNRDEVFAYSVKEINPGYIELEIKEDIRLELTKY